MAYSDKFSGLIAAIDNAKTSQAEMILVQTPETLGDDYAELVESLNRISAAGLMLQIVPPSERTRSDYGRN